MGTNSFMPILPLRRTRWTDNLNIEVKANNVLSVSILALYHGTITRTTFVFCISMLILTSHSDKEDDWKLKDWKCCF